MKAFTFQNQQQMSFKHVLFAPAYQWLHKAKGKQRDNYLEALGRDFRKSNYSTPENATLNFYFQLRVTGAF